MPGIPPITPYPLPAKENLPENLAQWVINPPHAVILIHDMQRFFLKPFPGRLRTDLIHNAAALRKRCAELGSQ